MKRTVFTAVALTTVLAFFAPLAQAESLRFSLSNGQPDSTYRPFGRSAEAIDNSFLSDQVDL